MLLFKCCFTKKRKTRYV